MGQSQHHDHDDHEHGHSHDDHGHGHDDHGHEHGGGFLGTLRELLPFGHGHSHGAATVDSALEGSEKGIKAIKISIVALGAATAIQMAIFWFSGSVALLADTLHNFVDAVNGIPLWMALVLSRRAANTRYTYGYSRAEDLAGLVIVLLIAASAVASGWESYQRFLNPQPIPYVGWVIAAAIIGFLGNEIVARYELKIGREIGSAALIADGQHARADGFTSLAVLLGAFGSMAGYPIADPIVGMLITIAIIFIAKDAALLIWHRLMDAVDPEIVEKIEQVASDTQGVEEVHDVRVRWMGHQLQAELHIIVDEDLTTRESHRIAEYVRHALAKAQPLLTNTIIHVDPCGHSGEDHHAPPLQHSDQLAS